MCKTTDMWEQQQETHLKMQNVPILRAALYAKDYFPAIKHIDSKLSEN